MEVINRVINAKSNRDKKIIKETFIHNDNRHKPNLNGLDLVCEISRSESEKLAVISASRSRNEAEAVAEREREIGRGKRDAQTFG